MKTNETVLENVEENIKLLKSTNERKALGYMLKTECLIGNVVER